MLMRISVINSKDGCRMLLSSQLRHSKQSDTLAHQATAEMMRRDQEEVVSQIRSEFQFYHHVESQSEEFQQSQE